MNVFHHASLYASSQCQHILVACVLFGYLVVDIGDDLMSRYDHSSWKSVIVQSRSFRCFETGFGVGIVQRFS